MPRSSRPSGGLATSFAQSQRTLIDCRFDGSQQRSKALEALVNVQSHLRDAVLHHPDVPWAWNGSRGERVGFDLQNAPHGHDGLYYRPAESSADLSGSLADELFAGLDPGRTRRAPSRRHHGREGQRSEHSGGQPENLGTVRVDLMLDAVREVTGLTVVRGRGHIPDKRTARGQNHGNKQRNDCNQ
jgi:hypothetical protein